MTETFERWPTPRAHKAVEHRIRSISAHPTRTLTKQLHRGGASIQLMRETLAQDKGLQDPANKSMIRVKEDPALYALLQVGPCLLPLPQFIPHPSADRCATPHATVRLGAVWLVSAQRAQHSASTRLRSHGHQPTSADSDYRCRWTNARVSVWARS